jgi:hypothetical protein
MNKIKINDDNIISFYNTEWNDNVLECRTNEIFEIKFDSIKRGEELLNLFEEECNNSSIKFSAIRINSNSKDIKLILENENYSNIETSIRVESNIKRFQENKLFEKFKISLEMANDDDLNCMKNISKNDFNYGRFFEDPNISLNSSRQRNSNWIDDLYEKSNLLVSKKKGNLFAFMAYKRINSDVNLEFGGVDSKYSHLSYPFWYFIIRKLKDEGVSDINALVSGSNLPIINLYSRFDFRFVSSFFGYRKFRK